MRGSYPEYGTGGAGPAFVQGRFDAGNPTTTGDASRIYKFFPMNPLGAGNCLVLKMTWNPTSASVSSISDAINGSWSATPYFTQTGANNKQAIFLLPNSLAGQPLITVTFSAPVQPMIPTLIELSGIALSSPGNGFTGQVTQTFNGSTAITAGTLSPGNNPSQGGNYILAFCDPDAANISNVTSFSASGGLSLLDANISGVDNQTIAHASSFLLQTGNSSSITPGFSPTGNTTNAFNLCAIALKGQLGAGTPRPTSGLYIVKRIWLQTNLINATTWSLQFPTMGTARMAASTDPYGANGISITDSESNTWAKFVPTNGAAFRLCTLNNTSANPNLTLTVTFNNGAPNTESHVALFDIVNQKSSGSFLGAEAENQGAASVTTVNNCPAITPTSTNSTIFYFGSNGNGPTRSMPNPGGLIYDNVQQEEVALTTTAATTTGATLTFGGGVPSTILAGQILQDDTTLSVIPGVTRVNSTTATTVVMSNNVTGAGVGNGDTIRFFTEGDGGNFNSGDGFGHLVNTSLTAKNASWVYANGGQVFGSAIEILGA